MTDPVAVDSAPEPPPSRSTRRALLGGGMGGVIGGIAAVLAVSRSANAAAGSEDLAAFAIGIELAARDLYRLSDNAEWDVFATNHESYAERIAGIVGVSADTRDDALFESLAAGFESGDAATALELENSLAATHSELLVDTNDGALLRAIASIVSAESRQAATLAVTSGAGLDAAIDNPAESLAFEA